MAKAPKSTTQMSAGLAAFAVAASATTAPQAETTTTATDATPVTGKHEFNPAIKSDAQVLVDAKAAREAQAAAEKQEKADKKAQVAADKQAAKDAAAAERKAKADAAAADKAAKAEAKAAAKAEREARMAELANGRAPGSMLALADKVKQGVYVKSATGQLHSGDELATALDGISATDVIRIGLDVLKLEENPYAALNVGQQSMNLRNRMRGAIKKQVLTIADITGYVERNKIVQVKAEDIAKARAEKAEKAATAKAEREAKAAAKAEPKADAAA